MFYVAVTRARERLISPAPSETPMRGRRRTHGAADPWLGPALAAERPAVVTTINKVVRPGLSVLDSRRC